MHKGYLIDQPCPSWLTDLAKNNDQPLCEELIKNALIDSIFYPACGTDGEVIELAEIGLIPLFMLTTEEFKPNRHKT